MYFVHDLSLFFYLARGDNIGRPTKANPTSTTYTSKGGGVTAKIEAGELYPKQAEFWNAKELYVCYGGARGGGKSHVVDRKAIEFALKYPGFKGLIVRRQYDDLLQNHIEPMKKLLPEQVAEYKESTHMMNFFNGSTIKYGHFNYDASADKYQGQEYDCIFMDEATQFTYDQFRMLGGCLRGVNDIPKHFYLTCNPGGIGHRWVKRLFIDRNYEGRENPKDYRFIFAKVDDNKALLENSPAYIDMLEALPEKIRAAHRDGDWNALSGAYFDEFRTDTHVVKPFPIPHEWHKYRSFDYGLDMFACYWVAVDEVGHCYVYREYCESGLIVPEAAQAIHDNTALSEHIDITFAPPDMWNTQKSDGKTMAESFMLNEVPIVKVSNNRVQGHMQIKEMLAPLPEKDKPKEEWKPQLMFFDTCKQVIDDIAVIQADEKNPNDCAKQPHEITHTVDGVRYFCISRTMPAIQEKEKQRVYEDESGETVEDYESAMCGGEITASYIGG